MSTFTNQDVVDYYDQTEVHYRLNWKLKEGMGLHYGLWEHDTKSIGESVLNTNRFLMNLGEVKATDKVLDAGCGIGGSSVYLAKNKGCNVTGITLSEKQVRTATALAKEKGVSDKVSFLQRDYTATGFEDNSFDIVWAIESMQTAEEKGNFFKEMTRILKPGGKILMADVFKPQPYDISKEKDMLVMLNGWAIADIISIPELRDIIKNYNFEATKVENVSKPVEKSVKILYRTCLLGMVSSEIYNAFHNTSRFAKGHYKTGLAQHKTFYKKLWGYYLLVLTNRKSG